MNLHYEDETVKLWHGDCIEVMRTLPDSSVDSVVCDPPYGLANTDPAHVAETITRWVNGERDYLPGGAGFMGKAWDAFVPPVAVWDECMRVLKPGGHVLAFAGSRTVDLMTLGIRLAGFDIRDSIAWLYGSGFPKSLDVSKAIDKAAGAEREVVGISPHFSPGRNVDNFGVDGVSDLGGQRDRSITAPATPDAEQWQGWGTALKPAFEPIVVARKPLSGTVAQTVLEHGTGALNIDGCRVGTNGGTRRDGKATMPNDAGWENMRGHGVATLDSGRWPANVVLDESQAEALDEQSGESKSPPVGSVANTKGGNTIGTFAHEGRPPSSNGHGDSGGASRFFPTFRYEAKAPQSERPKVNGTAHPTVKPLDLCRWLVRLVTPPGGTVLEPFAGSGTTVEACVIEGFRCIAIEKTDEYLPLTVARIHRRRDPVAAIKLAGDDLGLFDLEEDIA